MTAVGIVRNGSRASSPSEVALSKPTSEKIATTAPRPMPGSVAPRSES